MLPVVCVFIWQFLILGAHRPTVHDDVAFSKRELIQQKEDTNQTDSISRSGETVYDLFICLHG